MWRIMKLGYLMTHLRISDNQCNGAMHIHTWNNLKRYQPQKSYQPFCGTQRDHFTLNFYPKYTLSTAWQSWSGCLKQMMRNSDEGVCLLHCTSICTLIMAHRNCCSSAYEEFWWIYCTVKISHQVTFSCIVSWKNIWIKNVLYEMIGFKRGWHDWVHIWESSVTSYKKPCYEAH